MPLTLGSGGTATYTANFTTAGVHTLVAQYAGDTTHAASTGTVAITIAGTSSGKGTFAFAFSPSTLTISQGSAGTENLTITPSGGYTGTIDFNVAYSNSSALANLCVYASTGFNSNGSASITGTAPLSAQIGIDANGANCAATRSQQAGRYPSDWHSKDLEKQSAQPCTPRNYACRAVPRRMHRPVLAEVAWSRGHCGPALSRPRPFGLRRRQFQFQQRLESTQGNLHHYLNGTGFSDRDHHDFPKLHINDRLAGDRFHRGRCLLQRLPSFFAPPVQGRKSQP